METLVAGPKPAVGMLDCLDIEIGEPSGSIRVHDPRLFRADRRDFCRRLIDAIARQPGLRRAEVDLATASCRIEFSGGNRDDRSLADSFVQAVRRASSGSKPRWWRRRAGWSALIAVRVAGSVTSWEISEPRPGQVRLRRRHPGSVPLARVAASLARLDGVESCRVGRWSRQITIRFRGEGPRSGRIGDGIEEGSIRR